VDRKIFINNIKNVVSCNDWKYYNKNNTFHYVVDNYSINNGLDIAVYNGDYIITNIKVYKLNYDKVVDYIGNFKKISLTRDAKSLNIFTGKVELDESDIIYLQMPYDKGYSIKVNNKIVDYENVSNGMIGFYAEKGNNVITIEYNAPLLKISKIITIFSIFGLIIYVLKQKKVKSIDY
jgi:uncharacterized membrane protein YfhO